MSAQAHGLSLHTEPAGSGATPSVVGLSLIAALTEGHTFAASGAPVGSLVSDVTEGYDVTLGDFSADARVIWTRGEAIAY